MVLTMLNTNDRPLKKETLALYEKYLCFSRKAPGPYPGALPVCPYYRSRLLATEHREDALRSLVGLGHHSLGGLAQNLRAGKIHHFRRHISILNVRFG